METKTKLSDQLKWTRNPYLMNKHGVNVVGVSGEDKVFSNAVTDPHKAPGMVRVRTVSNESYVKIYTAFISQWFELSPPAQKVLGHIITVLPINDDLLHLPIEELQGATGYNSEVSIYSALNELINQRVIARHTAKGFYFINPQFLFNGNRMLFVEGIQRSPEAVRERIKVLSRPAQGKQGAEDSEPGPAEPDQGDNDLMRHVSEKYGK